ncbi:ABC transporter substrate-binding protein [Phytomonospora endophytica]|uniref:Iron complex transport system substrate-binding protein n=1 Tax=Phytomonospora endophytica TaxID=714109 RepID=A0A841FUQ1_9ACTN|nr:ABC transporter substrate-binding protein [Phytomonospora endophytica]MBB6037458.1 iron complex transport system substrate-binding protein [Phytomonospora endophytica]GIG70708.1 ABC transporter substrate-binding protein [Phytomonospora endophytica]
MQRRHLLGRLAVTTAALTALATGLVACGGDDKPTGEASPDTAAQFPVTVGDTTVAAKPSKIVSLSATGTEMLYAIGAGTQITAVDSTSNFPAEAPTKAELTAMDATAESVAAFAPDLVVLYFDPGNVAEGLKALNIPVYLTPAAATIDDAYTQLSDLGRLTGHTGEAETVVGQMKADIAEIVAGAPKSAKPVSYYWESDDSYYSLTSSTFVGSLLGQVGMESIADPADPDGKAFGYPQLSLEHIFASDPAMIVLADTKCCGQTAETVAARDGWDSLTAVKEGRVVALDDDIASRWGPRVVDLLRQVVAGLPAA